MRPHLQIVALSLLFLGSFFVSLSFASAVTRDSDEPEPSLVTLRARQTTLSAGATSNGPSIDNSTTTFPPSSTFTGFSGSIATATARRPESTAPPAASSSELTFSEVKMLNTNLTELRNFGIAAISLLVINALLITIAVILGLRAYYTSAPSHTGGRNRSSSVGMMVSTRPRSEGAESVPITLHGMRMRGQEKGWRYHQQQRQYHQQHNASRSWDQTSTLAPSRSSSVSEDDRVTRESSMVLGPKSAPEYGPGGAEERVVLNPTRQTLTSTQLPYYSVRVSGASGGPSAEQRMVPKSGDPFRKSRTTMSSYSRYSSDDDHER